MTYPAPITFNGLTLSIGAWAKLMGIKPGTLSDRLHLGWPVQRALLEPVRTPKQWHVHRRNAKRIATMTAAFKQEDHTGGYEQTFLNSPGTGLRRHARETHDCTSQIEKGTV